MDNWICVVSSPPTLLWAGGLFFNRFHGESSRNGNQGLCREFVKVHHRERVEYPVRTSRRCHFSRYHHGSQTRRIEGLWLCHDERTKRSRQSRQHVQLVFAG